MRLVREELLARTRQRSLEASKVPQSASVPYRLESQLSPLVVAVVAVVEHFAVDRWPRQCTRDQKPMSQRGMARGRR
jgi:hypothetical protein